MTTEQDLLEEALRALADIAFSDDMTLEVAKKKAKRIYEKLCAEQKLHPTDKAG